MKPIKNFFFLLAVLLLLGFIALLFPPEVKLLAGNLTIKIPHWNTHVESVKANESLTTEPVPVIAEQTEPIPEAIPEPILEIDSSNFSTALKAVEIDSFFLFPKDLAAVKAYPLTFAPQNPYELDCFFESLAKAAYAESTSHLLHYGDSQIEGDRITRTIRKYLQQAFGGKGVGLLPLVGPVLNSTFSVKYPQPWGDATSVLLQRDKDKYGVNMGYLTQTKGNTAALTISKTTYASPSDREYERLILLTSRSLDSAAVQLFDGAKQLSATPEVSSQSEIRRFSWDLPKSPEVLKINFSEQSSFALYGVSLESDHGFVVDNIPLRGNAGRIFTMNDAKSLVESVRFLNSKLIILQFGVNVIPQDPNEIKEDFDLYESMLYNQLRYLKKYLPDVGVLVIGVSDRSRKTGVGYETNPNVMKVRDAQKRAAMRSGCVFWDLFEAMGGESSMVKWVENTPALANKDYVHFSQRGAVKVGEMFYKSLMYAYIDYLKTTSQPLLSSN